MRNKHDLITNTEETTSLNLFLSFLFIDIFFTAEHPIQNSQ